MRIPARCAWIVLLPWLLGATPVTEESDKEQKWTRFRGPNGSGVATAVGIPTQWTDRDYLWKAKLPGVGHSSPVIWQRKVFLTSAIEATAERVVLCLDIDTGKILWQRSYPSSVHHKHLRNSFASSTPALDKDHVYTCWSSPEEYIVLALDHNGNDVWKTNLGPVVSQHSTGTSPVVFEDMLVLGNFQDGPIKENKNEGVSFLVSLNCKDGKERWRTPRENAVVSYSTPCVFQPTADSKPELIFNSEAHGITSVDPYTGKVNWELGVFDKRTVSSPIAAAGLIFGTVGSGGGGNYVAAVKPASKSPDRPAELAYKVTQMAPYVPTLVAKDKLLFLWNDKGIVSCVNAATGEQHWRQRVGGNFSGSPIIVNDRVYCIAEDGEVVVVAASAEYKLLGKSKLGEGSHSTPAVAQNRLFLRTFSHLYCLGGK